MNIKENIKIAIFSIKTNLMRSLLTMLGIIIGVAAVIAIITLGNGGRDYIVGMIKNMGSSVINISINSKETNASDYITDEDIKAIKNLDSVAYVSQVTMSVGNVTTKHNESLGLAIAGNADLGNMMTSGMLSGRFFNEEDYIRLKDSFILDSEKMKLARDDMYVLHPLPRVNEISTDVDNDPRAVYFKQVKFGVYVRMALIITLLGLKDKC